MYTIITRDQCNFCDFAKALMDGMGLAYNVVNIQDMDNRWVVEMMKRGELKTVPQVFSPAGNLIGGYSDLKEFFMVVPE
jgi:glutaredoxin